MLKGDKSFEIVSNAILSKPFIIDAKNVRKILNIQVSIEMGPDSTWPELTFDIQ